MEEQEVSTEHLHEVIHDHSAHHGHQIPWAEKVALTTALLALLAAVSNLISTHESDKAIKAKIEASDRWSFYQAKSIKELVTQDASAKARYKTEEEEIRKQAEEASLESTHATHTHEFFAYAVTLFQVATAVGAIAVLVRRKWFWFASLLLGAGGLALAFRASLLLMAG